LFSRVAVAYAHPRQIPCRFIDSVQVICGECFLGNVSEEELEIKPLTKQLWCPKYDHFEKGEQSVYELFTIDCSICLDEVEDKDRIVTPCGKV
jgi:hypothetical protein